MAKHALVLGASGIVGYAVCAELLSKASAATFDSVTGTSVRPIEDSGLPQDGRLRLVSGIDLTLGEAAVKKLLQDIDGIEKVTHVYYTALLALPDVDEKVKVNVSMFESAVKAVNELCPRLEFILLQTGSMYYGLEYSDHVPYTPPFSESKPRVPEPFYSKIHYYPQIDFIASFAKGKAWRWAEVRPDLISGFVPRGNVMNIVEDLALFLATYRYVKGAGAKVTFPGTEAGWKTRTIVCDATLLARFNVWLSTVKAKEVDGEAWNVGDGDITSWNEIFPAIAAWFGLEAIAPRAGQDGGAEAQAWWKEKGAEAYGGMVKEMGLKESVMGEWQWGFLRACTSFFFRDRYFDLSKAKALGWNERQDAVEGYLKGFERYAEFGVIPRWGRK